MTMGSFDHIPANLKTIAERHGYYLEYRGTVRRRGWPQRSAKPFGIYFSDGSHLASFATLAALERNFRARAGL